METSSSLLSPERCIRAVKMAAVAAISLYGLLMVVAEPFRAMAISDTETAVVQVTINAAIGLACGPSNSSYVVTYGSGQTLSLGTITFTGDTAAYAPQQQVTCKVTTNDRSGYTLAWQVLTGSGGGSTGRLISTRNDKIPAIGTGTFNNTFAFPSTATKSGWGGRVSSTSSGSVSGMMNFGTDNASELYARVATGTSITIRQSATNAQNGGDLIRVQFRAYVGSSVIQPSGTYQTTVTFTSTGL